MALYSLQSKLCEYTFNFISVFISSSFAQANTSEVTQCLARMLLGWVVQVL
ncbi:hypothetical protein PMAN_a2418 [Pseudoalteromonas marina]|nr:hypothetical protein PMAN_a2418 [Pseudoalteromonas marina]